MKLLFVVPYPPNEIAVRPNNFIRALADLGHRITLVTQFSDEAERATLQALAPCCEQLIALHHPRSRAIINSAVGLFSAEPLQAHYAFQPALMHTLRKLIDGHHFDAIHVEHLRGARYAMRLKQQLGASCPPLIWDSVDCISLLFARAAQHSKTAFGRMMTRFELPRTRRFERRMLAVADHTVVTSQADADALQALTPQPAPLSVVSNGVDLEQFRPNPNGQRHRATIVVSGKMSYHANVTMVLRLVNEIMPIVWSKQPDVRLQIVGKNPHTALHKLSDNRIELTGFVPQIQPYLQAATLAVAPLAYGVGIQNKVLEAMACATPVVAAAQAASALSAHPNSELLVANDDIDFADAILRLINNPALAMGIGRAGRGYVERNHAWSDAAAQLTTIYQQQVQRRVGVDHYHAASITPLGTA